MADLLIIIPLYRGVELIEGLFANLRSVAGDINALDAKVLLINDSPDDQGLAAALVPALQSLDGLIEAELLTNESNNGFVATSNRGLRRARDAGSDALLLNSDALITPGALQEMHRVANSDPLIAVVSPRSNNATICNSPYDVRFRTYDFDAALAAHRSIEPHLSPVTYVPTAVGFCLYIRHIILTEFGFLDEAYGAGYNEENDFILRCGRYGYRAVLANRAFVYHLGSVSFEQSGMGRSPREKKNRTILDDRYPEYARSIDRYFDGTEYLSQLLCSGLVPDRDGKLRIHFDCRNIGAYHNGTFEHAKRLLSAFVDRFHHKYNVVVSCSIAAYEFHDLIQISRVTFRFEDEPEESPYAVSIRLAQPFNWRDLVDVSCAAPVSGFLMLDTIAMDCASLDEIGLESLWRQMLNVVSFVGFNSQFTRDQFARRFSIPSAITEFVSLCSTQARDYSQTPSPPARHRARRSILVVGNHFVHKNVRAGVELLKRSATEHKIVVLGVAFPEEPALVSFKSGSLTQEEVDALYQDASVVLFPSHYEGFGLPIMHALARGLPVVARTLPVFEEIRARTEHGRNVHLRASTEEMVAFALTDPQWASPQSPARPAQTWERASEDLEEGITRAIARFDGLDLRRRMESAELCRNWFDAMDQADALWLGGERTSTRRLSQASRQDQSRTDLRARLVSYARHNHLFWNAKLALQRLSVRQAARAEAVLPALAALPDGESIQVTSSDVGKIPGTGAFRLVHAGNFLDAFSVRDVGIRLLEISDRILVGGGLYFELRASARRRNLPVDLNAHQGIRVLCANAGLRVVAIEDRGQRTLVAAVKVQPWLGIELKFGDDTQFVQNLYRAAFRRNSDADAEIYVNELRKGSSRLSLAKKLFTSTERINVLTRPAGRARFS